MAKINSYNDLLAEKERLQAHINGNKKQLGKSVETIKEVVSNPLESGVFKEVATQLKSKPTQAWLTEAGAGLLLNWGVKIFKKKGMAAAKKYALPVAGGAIALYFIKMAFEKKKK